MKAIPHGYAGSVFGVVEHLLVGGALDFIWHAVFGFEHQLDLLLSPPHLFLLSGLFFLVTGPIRSALARPSARRLVEQLPMLISLGIAFEIIQFCTQYGFYPEALLRDRPLAQSAFRSEQFVLSVFLFYKQSLEISTVIWQSLLLSAAVLYLCVRKHLRFGALIVVSVAVKLWICGEIANDLKEVLLVVLAAVAAGAIGDFIVAKLGAGPRRPNAFHLLGFAVPSAYCPPRTSRSPFPSSEGRGGTRALIFRLDRRGWARRPLRQPTLPRGIANDYYCMKPRLSPIAYALALLCTAIHLAFCHRFGLYRDELYFIDCAKHLAWGYVDQPPLAPLVTWLTGPLGYPVWAVRFFPSLLAGVTVLLGCAIAREFGGRSHASALNGAGDRSRSRGSPDSRLRAIDGVSFAGGVVPR